MVDTRRLILSASRVPLLLSPFSIELLPASGVPRQQLRISSVCNAWRKVTISSVLTATARSHRGVWISTALGRPDCSGGGELQLRLVVELTRRDPFEHSHGLCADLLYPMRLLSIIVSLDPDVPRTTLSTTLVISSRGIALEVQPIHAREHD